MATHTVYKRQNVLKVLKIIAYKLEKNTECCHELKPSDFWAARLSMLDIYMQPINPLAIRLMAKSDWNALTDPTGLKLKWIFFFLSEWTKTWYFLNRIRECFANVCSIVMRTWRQIALHLHRRFVRNIRDRTATFTIHIKNTFAICDRIDKNK